MADYFISDGLITSDFHATKAENNRAVDWRYNNVGADCQFADPAVSAGDTSYDNAKALIRVLKCGGAPSENTLVPQVKGVRASTNGQRVEAADYSAALKDIFKSRLPTINELLTGYSEVPSTRATTPEELIAARAQLQVLWAGFMPTDLRTVIIIWSMPIVLLRADLISLFKVQSAGDGETPEQRALRVATEGQRPQQGIHFVLVNLPAPDPLPAGSSLIGESLTQWLKYDSFTESDEEYAQRLRQWEDNKFAITGVAVSGRVMKLSVSRNTSIDNTMETLTVTLPPGTVGAIVPTYVTFNGYGTERKDIYKDSVIPLGVYDTAPDQQDALVSQIVTLSNGLSGNPNPSAESVKAVADSVQALFNQGGENATSAVPDPPIVAPGQPTRAIDEIIVARNDDGTAVTGEPTNALVLSTLQVLSQIPCVVPYTAVECQRFDGTGLRSLSIAAARFLLHGDISPNRSFGFQGVKQRIVQPIAFEQNGNNSNYGGVFVIAPKDIASGTAEAVFLQASPDTESVNINSKPLAKAIQIGKTQTDISKGAIGQSVKASSTINSMSLADAPLTEKTVTGDQDIPYGGGGGGGESFFTAIVYGGNCTQTVAPFDALKFEIYSIARFPTPLNPKKAVLWTKLDLPITFNHGDAIPSRTDPPAVTPIDATWPSGLGLARLCRGSPAVGTSTWDADVYAATPTVALNSVPYFAGFKSPTLTTAYVYFDKPPVAVDYTKIILVDNGTPTAYAITAATISSSRVQLTFSSPVTITATQAVRFLPGGVTQRTVVDDTGTSKNYTNTADIDVLLDTSGAMWMGPVPAVTGVIARDLVYDPATPTSLQVYFTGLLATTPPPANVILSAPADTITISGGTVDTADRSHVTYTISTPTDAQLQGAITGNIGAGGTTFVQGDIPSGPTAATTNIGLHVKAARNCYIRIANRFTERNYDRGDIVQFSVESFVTIPDDTGDTRVFYDSRLVESQRDKSYLYQVVGGNALPYLSAVGIKRITTTLATIPPGYTNGTPTTTIDGVGWVRCLDDDTLRLVINDATSQISHDVITGTPVWCMVPKNISDGAGGTYSVLLMAGVT